MALIICPECGKQVSDQSDQCVYCGYPIKQNTNCTINGIKFDLGFLLDDKIEYGTKCRMFALQHGCEIGQSRYYIDKIIETGIIPKTLTVKTVDDVIKEQETLKPHCPVVQLIYKKYQELNGGFLLDCLVWQVVILVRVCVVKSVGINGDVRTQR